MTDEASLKRIADAGLNLCLGIDKLRLSQASRSKMNELSAAFFKAVKSAKKIKNLKRK